MKNNKVKNTAKKEVLDWIKTIAISLIIVYIINNGLIVNAKIPTCSMENTIMTNDRLFANRLAYLTSEPERGDIIVFKYPDNHKELYVKRIIGLPNEEVTIHDGKVFINGDALKEDYVEVKTKGQFGPYKVPEGHYFMLGDNRNSSKDSRFWEDSYVARSEIVGKVFIKYFPYFKVYN